MEYLLNRKHIQTDPNIADVRLKVEEPFCPMQSSLEMIEELSGPIAKKRSKWRFCTHCHIIMEVIYNFWFKLLDFLFALLERLETVASLGC